MTESTQFFPKRLLRATQVYCREVPSLMETRKFVDHLMNLLFPIRQQNRLSLRQIEAGWEEIQEEFAQLVEPIARECQLSAGEITAGFFKEIPLIHTRLLRDADAFRRNDPAAHCSEEVVLCYPGFYAIAIYRMAHVLYKMHIPILPRVISEYAHSSTGIDIHPGATIGERLYIDHGTGIVVGETTIIGKNVKLYQGVTLGARYVEKSLSGTKRHPTIEDNTIIYAGSTILGGNTVIGHDSIIGGNVWITESVPPYSVVSHKPEIVIRKSKKEPPK
ncbi:MAG: serine O-acetyltransferase EpsC [Bacteroidales bacterium]